MDNIISIAFEIEGSFFFLFNLKVNSLKMSRDPPTVRTGGGPSPTLSPLPCWQSSIWVSILLPNA